MTRARCVLLSMLCLLTSGCGGDPGPVAEVEPSVSAAGVVTFRGQPLSQHRVVLMPEDGRRPAMGVTNAEGKFTLGTNEEGDGAPPGRSKVAIVWAGPETTVEAVDQSAIDDPEKMPEPDVQIPAKYTNAETSGLTAEIPEAGTSDLKFELQ